MQALYSLKCVQFIVLIQLYSVAAKEIGLEVNADKTKYMVMSRDQNAGRTHSMKIDNSSSERVEVGIVRSRTKATEFREGGRVQIFGNNLHVSKFCSGRNKSRLKSGNACYHSVQNLLSSSLLSKN